MREDRHLIGGAHQPGIGDEDHEDEDDGSRHGAGNLDGKPPTGKGYDPARSSGKLLRPDGLEDAALDIRRGGRGRCHAQKVVETLVPVDLELKLRITENRPFEKAVLLVGEPAVADQRNKHLCPF